MNGASKSVAGRNQSMSDRAKPAGAERVLVLGPSAGDESLSRQILTQAGLTCHVCHDLDRLPQELGEGADALLLTDEVLAVAGRDCLIEVLRHQPAWSDLPILLLANEGTISPVAITAMELLGNVAILERSMQMTTLVSVLRVAVRARRRQYQFRDQMGVLSRTQKAMTTSESTLRHLLERLPAGAYTCDPDGLITYFNQQAAQLWGRAPNLNDPADRFCGSFKLYGMDGSPVAHDQCWMALALRTGDAYSAQEIVIERPDGARFTVLAHAFPLRDEFEKLVGAVNVVVDITERKQAEEFLRLQAQVAASMAEGVCLIRARDAVIVYANERFEKMFGYCPGELLGKPAAALNAVGGRSPEETAAAIIRSLTETGVWRGEVQNVRKDGTAFWTYASVSTFEHSKHGTVWTSVQGDITERKMAEQALQQNEERLNLAVYAADLGIFEHDHHTGATYWSPITRTICGCGAKEPASLQGYFELIHPEDRENIISAVHQAHAPVGDGMYRVEHRLVRPDGSIRWVSACSRTFFEGEVDAQQPLRTVGVLADITERKRAEEKINHLAAIVQSSDDAIISRTLDGIIVSWNRGAERIFGFTAEEVKGRSISLLVVPPTRVNEVPHVLEELQSGNSIARYETVRKTKDGKLIDVSVTVSPIRAKDGRITGTSAIARDISERKRAEKKLREYTERIQALSRQLLTIQEEERSHLARELHDGICQTLTVAAMEFELGLSASSEAAPAKFAEARDWLDRAVSQLRQLSLDLRPAMLDHLGLLPALLWFFESLKSRSGIQVHFRHEGLHARFAPTTETTAYRLVQEALELVVWNTGVKVASLRIWSRGGMLNLQLECEGAGFDSAAALSSFKTSSLTKMQERVQLLGGTLSFDSTPGEGTELMSQLPLEP